MALPEGTRLGPYEIGAPLGAGGMGEVYRARDTRLDRTVALKVLSPALAASPELEARFEREARAIAALQHPHICVLHDLGREGSTAYLVMEFLEGETLSARLRRGPLPLAEIIRIGAQVAEALDAAHRAGIVHRDLKPGNIMLTRGGAQVAAKLLDFGLAKPGLAAARPASAPTFTATLAPTEPASPVTQAGVVMGTVQYMSPEQIEGREADARSDVFALGCVLYEMAAGKPAFEGKSSLSVASAILEKDPPPVAPAALDRVIRLCLVKAPEERLQSARDAALLLRAVKADAPAPADAAGRRRPWPTALAGAAVGAAALAVVLWLRPRTSRPRMVADLPAPAGVRFTFSGDSPGPPAISPDGSEVVFAAQAPGQQRQLWLRRLGQAEAQPLPGTMNAYLPFWSPDGQEIGFFVYDNMAQGNGGRLLIYGLESGQTRTLAQTGIARGGTWAADGTILFAPNTAGGLERISATGGAATSIPLPESAEYTSLRFPYFLPDGRHFLYLAVSHSDSNHDQIYFASLDGKVNRPLVHATTGGVYAAAGGKGYLLYSANGTLMAQPMRSDDGTLVGAAQPVAHGVFEDGITWRPAFSASRTGDLAYAAGAVGDQQLVWLDRSGKVTGALPPYAGAGFTAALSPNGDRLALSIDNGEQDIWVMRLSDGSRARFTFGPIANLFPVWSPHGDSIAYDQFLGEASRVVRRPANGGGEAQTVDTRGLGPLAAPVGWTPDGKQLLVADTGSAGDPSALGVYAVPLEPGQKPRMIVAPSDSVAGYVALSPDGRWVSYAAGLSGQLPNLFVAPFAGGDGNWQVTTRGVESYFWADGGKELEVIDGEGTLEAIPVSVSAGAPVFGAPRALARHLPTIVAATADGQRFLAITYPDDHQRLVYVRNWAAALH